jgi:hypothetical protein
MMCPTTFRDGNDRVEALLATLQSVAVLGRLQVVTLKAA